MRSCVGAHGTYESDALHASTVPQRETSLLLSQRIGRFACSRALPLTAGHPHQVNAFSHHLIRLRYSEGQHVFPLALSCFWLTEASRACDCSRSRLLAVASLALSVQAQVSSIIRVGNSDICTALHLGFPSGAPARSPRILTESEKSSNSGLDIGGVVVCTTPEGLLRGGVIAPPPPPCGPLPKCLPRSLYSSALGNVLYGGMPLICGGNIWGELPDRQVETGQNTMT
mmetsp:Transcript_26417/g.41869  ORF Transcript_26417/g.41869 Transcript_26417/m.41869 type:complete len:228 (+) Transcript_26417:193-876(+)